MKAEVFVSLFSPFSIEDSGLRIVFNKCLLSERSEARCYGPDLVGWLNAVRRTSGSSVGLASACMRKLYHRSRMKVKGLGCV